MQRGSQLVASVGEGGPQLSVSVPGAPAWKPPCTVTGLSGALGGGALGFLFGLLPSAFRNKGKNWHLIRGDAWTSAKNFALLSGVYAAANCLAQRVRQVDDKWNRTFAGGASGVALGWSSGPLYALQSGLFLGMFSYVFDIGAATASPSAACTTCCCANSCLRPTRLSDQQAFLVRALSNPQGDYSALAALALASCTQHGLPPCSTLYALKPALPFGGTLGHNRKALHSQHKKATAFARLQ